MVLACVATRRTRIKDGKRIDSCEDCRAFGEVECHFDSEQEYKYWKKTIASSNSLIPGVCKLPLLEK